MTNEINADYTKCFLLPPSMEDWVPNDHPVRFIREFVDNLDFSELNFQRGNEMKGRPNYSNNLLIKIWLYGYFECIYSSRGLEKACKNQLPLIWLTGMNYPDHNTIWRFFSKNKKSIKGLFKQTVQLAIKLDMVGFVVQAVDGTKIKANSSKDRSIHRADLQELLSKLDESLAGVMLKIEKTQDSESSKPGYSLPEKLQNRHNLKRLIEQGVNDLSKVERISLRDSVKECLESISEDGINHLSISDPEARLMKNKTQKEYSYNAQAVVDDKTQIIVGSTANNESTDFHNLTESLDDAVENTGRKSSESLADAGYFSGEELAKAEEKNYSVLVNTPQNVGKSTSKEERIVNKEDFTYDEDSDCYLCPYGKRLIFERVIRRNNRKYPVRIYRCVEFRDCPYRRECSKDKRGRTIEITPYEDAMNRQINKQKKVGKKNILIKRKEIIEPVFGWIKFNNKLLMWSYRGIESVEAQWNLICATINLKKIYKIWLRKKDQISQLLIGHMGNEAHVVIKNISFFLLFANLYSKSLKKHVLFN